MMIGNQIGASAAEGKTLHASVGNGLTTSPNHRFGTRISVYWCNLNTIVFGWQMSNACKALQPKVNPVLTLGEI